LDLPRRAVRAGILRRGAKLRELAPRQEGDGGREGRATAQSLRSNLDAAADLDDRIVRDLEEIRRTARDAIEEREDRKGDRVHRRSALAAHDGLVREIVI